MAIEIVDFDLIYKRLEGFVEEEQVPEEDFDPLEKLILNSQLVLPKGHQINGKIEMVRPYYRAEVEVISNDLGLFKNYTRRLTRQLNLKKMPYEVFRICNNLYYLKNEKDPYFSYGVKLKTLKNKKSLKVYYGDEGLSIMAFSSKKSDFVKKMGELEDLANILFYPFYRSQKDKETNSYYLNFFFNSERQSP